MTDPACRAGTAVASPWLSPARRPPLRPFVKFEEKAMQSTQPSSQQPLRTEAFTDKAHAGIDRLSSGAHDTVERVASVAADTAQRLGARSGELLRAKDE